jgi:small subunit ribosomal protein S14
MKYLNREDKKTRKIINKFFNKKLEIKNQKLINKENSDIQKNLAFDLSLLPKASGLTKLKNRCVITCKGRAVLRRFRITHTTLREQYSKGFFPGIHKKSF